LGTTRARIIAGPYGCGKSTFNRLLAYKWADTVGRRENARVSIVGWEFNEHDSTRAPNQTETEYVREMMIKVPQARTWARDDHCRPH